MSQIDAYVNALLVKTETYRYTISNLITKRNELKLEDKNYVAVKLSKKSVT